VTRKQRRDYERWRAATELTDEEQAIGLPDLPTFERSPAPRPRERSATPELTGDSLRDRLSGTRDPAEVAQILGRRRLAWYAFCSIAVSVAFGGYGIYLVVQVLLARASGWTLLALPPFVLVSLLSGSLGYAIAYDVLTGRTWPGATRVGRFMEIINNTNVVPRRRHR
jgi:hypothetical protein